LTDEIRLGRIVIQYSNSHSTPQIEIDSSSSAPRPHPGRAAHARLPDTGRRAVVRRSRHLRKPATPA